MLCPLRSEKYSGLVLGTGNQPYSQNFYEITCISSYFFPDILFIISSHESQIRKYSMNVQSSRLPLAHLVAPLLASGVVLERIGLLCRKMPNACTVGFEDTANGRWPNLPGRLTPR